MLADQTEVEWLGTMAQRYKDEMRAGTCSIDKAYRALTDNGERMPMYVHLPRWIDDELPDRADEAGTSRQAVLVQLLTQLFGEDWAPRSTA